MTWKHVKRVALTLIAVLMALGVVIALWIIWGLQVVEWWAIRLKRSSEGLTIAELGQVGDLFGGFNALFAALAFVGVAFAAYFQARTFALTREQHIRQSFEPLFFQLLNLHKSIEERARLAIPPGWHSTIDAPFHEPQRRLPGGAESLRERITNTWGSLVQANENDRLQIVERIYDEFYTTNEDELGPYFRSLYHIFRLIDQSDLDDEVQVTYANIARATLSSEELFLLIVNCITGRGRNFKQLIEKYGLLKHAHIGTANNFTVDGQLIRWFYSPTATMAEEERKAADRKPSQT